MLSAVVLTKNEEKRIAVCLKSLSFCDEIIVIDDNSTDKTRTVAQKYTRSIYQKSLQGNFARARNFGLSKARGNWVLFIDADEIVSSSLKQEIIKTIKQKRKVINGYFINREDIFLGKKMHYGETGNIKLIRLARKEKGLWKRPVHEIWAVRGQVGKLKNPLLHYSHNTISGMLYKIDKYSTINAKYLKSIKSPIHAYDIILYPIGKFLHNYILKCGFLDGIYGLIFAVMMSMHSFLTRAKLYLLTQHD